jgi:hypothetical protein
MNKKRSSIISEEKNTEINKLTEQLLDIINNNKFNADEEERRHYGNILEAENNKTALLAKHNELINDKSAHIIKLNDEFENEKRRNEQQEVGLRYSTRKIEEDL